MTSFKIKNHKEIREEMKAVARGGKQAPADAATPSVESAEVLLRIVLSERDTTRVLDLLGNPPKPTSALRAAARSHRRQTGR
jgi:hypothetical protein